MGARPYDPSLGRFLAVDPVDGGALNNYDYAAQDPVNKFDLNGMCFRDSAAAAGLDMDVAGSDRALCEAVAKMFLGCVAGFEAMNPTDLSEARIRSICWGAVDTKVGKRHKDLWKPEPLRKGKSAVTVADLVAIGLGCYDLGTWGAEWGSLTGVGGIAGGVGGCLVGAGAAALGQDDPNNPDWHKNK